MSLIPLNIGFSAIFVSVVLTTASVQDLELRQVETQQVADALALRSADLGVLDESKLSLELARFWKQSFVPSLISVDSPDGGQTHRVRFCRRVQPWTLAWLDTSLTRVQVCAESLARELGLGTNSGM